MSKILIGKILTCHGVKGYVKLLSLTEKPKDIYKYSDYLYDKSNKKFKINFIGTLKENIFITKIDGIDDREIAKSWRNTELYIDSNILPKKKDEFFYDELINFDVISDDKKYRGKIISIDDFGAGVIISIKWDNEKMEECIQYNNEYFKKIDLENKFVIVNRPKYM